MSEKTSTQDEPDAKSRGFRARVARFRERVHANPATSLTWKILVTVVGGLVLLAGVVMIFTPGQGILAVILGLAILATEWKWAERWLKRARDAAVRAKERSQAMDPRVRRRRIAFGAVAVLVVAGAVGWYVAAYGWPSYAVSGWSWVQGIAGWLPDLPGPTAGPSGDGSSRM